MHEPTSILERLTGPADAAPGKSLRRISVGKLLLPTGHIVACDPQAISGEEEAFVKSVPPGAYPVTLFVMKDDDGEWVAAAQIRFRPEAVARWETARTPEDGDLETVGYGVDDGVGCFVDASVLSEAGRLRETDEDFADTVASLIPDGANDPLWCAQPLSGKRANVVAFATGNGGGLYASHFGLNEAGELVSLVTDFEIWPPATDA